MISLWSGDTFSTLQVGGIDLLTCTFVKRLKRGLGLPIVVVIVVKWNTLKLQYAVLLIVNSKPDTMQTSSVLNTS